MRGYERAGQNNIRTEETAEIWERCKGCVKRAAVHAVWYNTSGFTFFIKARFARDERIVKLTDFVFDRFLK